MEQQPSPSFQASDETHIESNDDKSRASEEIGTPRAPLLVSAKAISSSSIRVSWNVVLGASGYKVYSGRACNSNPDSDFYTTSTYLDYVSLVSGLPYYFKVSAVNDYGEGPSSILVSARPFGNGNEHAE